MTASRRTLAFRTVAGILSVCTLIVGCTLFYSGTSGTSPWTFVLPSVLLQLAIGYAFGRFALGMPGPFDRPLKG